MINNKCKKIKEYKEYRKLNAPKCCEYRNCDRIPLFYFVTTDKWCCSANAKQCPANKDKSRQTVRLKYGVDNISQLECIKKQKITTCLENYGVPNPSKSHKLKIKKINTSIIKYGVENPSQNAEVKIKRNNTFLEKYDGHPLSNSKLILQRKQTMLERYGVDNYGKTQEHKDNLTEYYNSLSDEVIDEKTHRTLQTKFKLGIITDPLLKSKFERYYIDVRNLSNRNYKKNKSSINPNGSNRGRTLYHLDHIFSIKDGFDKNIPVEVISHRSNLRMLKYDENIVKGGCSDKSLSVLFEDFYRNT